MLEIEGLTKTFMRGSLFRRTPPVTALRDVSLSVAKGESFGLVGESGSGKSTLARCILRLDRPTSGRILFEGDDMARLTPAAMRRLRARIQVVWQDPYASLNPRMSVHDIVTEPLVVHRAAISLDSRGRTDRAAQILAQVGLGPQHLHRYPHEFSGGQRQRIGIARALVTQPALLLLDEPTSALDVSVQAQVLNLLVDLQARLGLTYFFISHDLSVIRYICDRVALLHRGELVEQGETAAIFDAPRHAVTRTLLAAMPEVVVPD